MAMLWPTVASPRCAASSPESADPNRELYRQYGVEPSVKGLFKGAARLPTLIRASLRGFLPGRIEGNPAMVPADFLIDADLVVREAYYGRDVGDHLSTDVIEMWLRKQRRFEPA